MTIHTDIYTCTTLVNSYIRTNFTIDCCDVFWTKDFARSLVGPGCFNATGTTRGLRCSTNSLQIGGLPVMM